LRERGMSEDRLERFGAYVEALAEVIGHADRMEPLRDYCRGLLLPGERKSVEPIAAVTAPARVSESVRKDYEGLQSFRIISLMEASRKKASALILRFSQSFASLLHRLSHARVRSTIQRLGRTANPFAVSERLTISVSS
jgi:hypothetical protein